MNLYEIIYAVNDELKGIKTWAENVIDAKRIVKIWNKDLEIKFASSRQVENSPYEEISREFVLSYYDNYCVKKVIKTGDKLFLLTSENITIEYVINDIAIGYPASSTTWSIGFYVQAKDENEHFIPYDIVHELMHNGLMWRENDNRIAETLRKIRTKQGKL